MEKETLEEKTVIAEKELARAGKKYGPDDPRLVDPLRRLGKLYALKGRHPEAIAILSRALTISDASGAGESRETADILNTLSVTLSAGGRFLESLPLMLRCLALQEQGLGPPHFNLAHCLNNVATIHMNINALDRAAEAMARAMTIAEEGFADDDPFWFKLWINMAGLCQYRKRPDEAEVWLQKVLGFKGLKPDDPLRAVALNNLGEIAKEQGQYEEARQLLQDALGSKQRQLGFDHPDLMTNLINLGQLYSKTGDAAKAESLFLEAIQIGEAKLGPAHHMVGVAYCEYGRSLFERGYDTSAGDNLTKALEIISAALGAGHPKAAEVHACLGDLCRSEGDLESAGGHYAAALEVFLRCYGPDKPEVRQLREKLGQVTAAEKPGRGRKARP